MVERPKGRTSIGGLLLFFLSLAILVAYLVELFSYTPPPPPSPAERAEEYRKQYEAGLRSCRYDYPNEEQLILELWQDYEQCARARAAVGMDYWETYR